jgi:hypothetical protein
VGSALDEQEALVVSGVNVTTPSSRLVVKLVAALMYGVAATFIFGVTSFLIAQPSSVLRLAIFLPAEVSKCAWAGAVAGAIMFLLLLRSYKASIRMASITLVSALVYWWVVQQPFVSGWLLPPVQGK